ncbi:TRAM domain-containing protein [Ruminococcaceae bacterium OttesenSCG-928-A11]|nr:TRAM domain-containing protein [Ruminococcaceae bacterium OttesenSCG-928-A11]
MEKIMYVVLFVVILILIETSYLSIKKFRERRLRVSRGSLLLDTSALMDGRITDVARSGIISSDIIIPKSVISEMQLLADKANSQKRSRARLGLDNVKKLQKNSYVNVNIINDGDLDSGGVDKRLVDLAKKYNASIATTDFNLNKVAKVDDIIVVNVNELSQMLRAQILPGEKIDIKIVQTGQGRSQGVGYLDDGTMVVVDGAIKNIGKKIKVEIERSLQTEAGRMMFAKKVRNN